ncbi:MAG TPA: hypothetical protein VJA65_05555, partial [bacterium]|nr:hypothetical protein [bacterium]
WLRYSALYGVVALMVVSSFLSPYFLTLENSFPEAPDQGHDRGGRKIGAAVDSTLGHTWGSVHRDLGSRLLAARV